MYSYFFIKMNNIKCPACHGDSLVFLESVGLEEQHAKYAPGSEVVQRRLCEEAGKAAPFGYRMQLCRGCGLEFANPLKAPNADWYGHAYATLSLYPSIRWEYVTTLKRMVPGGSVLDVGCGSGYYLQLCGRAGIKASGVDFAIDAVQSCRAAGLDVALLDVTEKAQNENREFDYITAFHVLEHMESPVGLFKYAERFGEKGTRFYVSIPGQYRASRYYKELDFLDQPPHHMSRWTEQSLRKVANSTRWRCLSVEHEALSYWIKLWQISRRTKFYLNLTRSLRSFTIMDKVARVLLLPYAIWTAGTKHRRMTGFSMLACYEMV